MHRMDVRFPRTKVTASQLRLRPMIDTPMALYTESTLINAHGQSVGFYNLDTI